MDLETRCSPEVMNISEEDNQHKTVSTSVPIKVSVIRLHAWNLIIISHH